MCRKGLWSCVCIPRDKPRCRTKRYNPSEILMAYGLYYGLALYSIIR